MNNQFKKVSTTAQPNTIPYSDENGYISNWLENDPVITSIKGQNEYIGSVATAPAPNTQSILTQFVIDTTGRQPRNGDEVAIEDVGELWMFNGTQWLFFTNTTLSDATTTSKGVVQIGSGLNVSSGVVSVDNTIYTPSRTLSTNTETTPSINLQENTDYVFSNALTSLTIGTVPYSFYPITLTFTTGTGFTFSATNITEYFYYTTPTFIIGKKYKLTIISGKCYIDYIGDRVYPINKITATNGSLTPSSNVATWTISNTLNTKDVILRIYETSSGETVEMDSTITASTITLTFYAESTVSAGFYTAVIIG